MLNDIDCPQGAVYRHLGNGRPEPVTYLGPSNDCDKQGTPRYARCRSLNGVFNGRVFLVPWTQRGWITEQ